MTSWGTVRARFTSSQGLPFAEVLTQASILEVLDEHKVEYRDRVFGPLTTLWGFLSQVLSDDHSGRDPIRMFDLLPLTVLLDWKTQRRLWQQLLVTRPCG